MAGPDSQGWQNTVRHNLSLGKIFIKKARTAQDIYDSCSSGNPSQSQAARGKGGWWTLHPVVLAQIRSGQRTHNDEFDDVERLVETENAAAKEGAVARVAGAAVMAATSSVSSADGRSAPRRSSAEISQHKTLSPTAKLLGLDGSHCGGAPPRGPEPACLDRAGEPQDVDRCESQ
ncbi:hypothetical protein L1887_43985 [Cichorium endivia]|nr:hypothetical protein L1887_43985 [Cichorium endivia]